jgi:hypothetical protein
MKTLSTCVLALALLVLGTSSAGAVTMTEYKVTVEGEATYARTDAYPAPFGQWEQRSKAAFKWKTQFPSVTFFGKQVSVSSVSSTSVSDIEAQMHVSIPTPEGPVTGACSGGLLTAPAGGGWFGDGVIPTPDPNMESLDIRVLGNVGLLLPNCTGAAGSGPYSFGLDGSDEPIPSGPFDHNFDMPHEAIGMGKIIQLLEAHVTGDHCPGYAEHTASCVLDWKATVTFDRIAQRELGPGEGGQPPAGGSDPDDGLVPMQPPVAPGHDPDEDLIPMPPARAKLSRDAAQAQFTLTCRVACSGSAAAYPAGRGARAAAAKPVGRTRFTAAAGRPTTIRLRFTPKARRAIRRAHAVRIELRVTPQTGGATVRRTIVVRLTGARAPRAAAA